MIKYPRVVTWPVPCRETAIVNLYHVTKFPLYLSFTVHYFYTYISSFAQFFSHKNCFEQYLYAVHFLFWEILNLNLRYGPNQDWWQSQRSNLYWQVNFRDQEKRQKWVIAVMLEHAWCIVQTT